MLEHSIGDLAIHFVTWILGAIERISFQSNSSQKVNKVTMVEPDSMHHARLKQRFYMHTDFTCIRIVPMHGFMKKSDYSCTVTMHVQKIQINSHPTYSVYDSSYLSFYGIM